MGGLCRTYYYAGHPYEFGPHIIMWENGDNPVTRTVRDLTDNKLFDVTRNLFSYIEKDKQYYRYPVHFGDISKMPDGDKIMEELGGIRDDHYRVDPDKEYPRLGKSTFKEYMAGRLGETLYNKVIKEYTHKMWGIPGDQMQTIISADEENADNSGQVYDPIKFGDHPLAKDSFCVYPEDGLNVIWDRMVEDVAVLQRSVAGVNQEYIHTNMDDFKINDFDFVFNTLAPDELLNGDKSLPSLGRLMLPLLLPDLKRAFPHEGESFHYSGSEAHTRVTEMKSITRYESTDTLLLIEMPITTGAVPGNVFDWSEENNLYSERAYPSQDMTTMTLHRELISRFHPKFRHSGRLAEWQYLGMAKIILSAFNLVESIS